MKVLNQTKKVLLAKEIIIPKSLIDQTLGLLRYKTPTAMLLKTRFGIHTLDMKYAIDVLILDKQNTVVALKENLKPNRIFLWKPRYETVIELPANSINKTQTEIGNTILLE